LVKKCSEKFSFEGEVLAGLAEGQLGLFFDWGQVEGEKAFEVRNQSNRMEILERKVMARFGRKLSLVRLGEAFDLAQLICQVLKSQKERKIEKVSNIRLEEVKLPFGR
jgi:hypothetical protein